MSGANWGDVPTWVAIGVAVASAVVASWAIVEARRARVAGEISATAAVRSAEAAERSLALQQEQAEEARPKDVDWELAWTSEYMMTLRNIGTVAAHGVTIDPAQATSTERLPNRATIGAGLSVEFLVVPDVESEPLPNELLVVWDGAVEPKPVRVPRRLV